MSGAETAGWLGTAKAKTVKAREIDSEVWVGKAEAAKLLKTSTRQLERRASAGEVAKRLLPRKAGEKSARVVYSRSDIQNLLDGGGPQLDLSEQAIAWITKAEGIELLGVSPRIFDSRVRQGCIEKANEGNGVVFSMADIIALKSGRPIQVRKSAQAITRRPDAPASNDPFHGLAAQLAGLAAFAAQFPAPAAAKPWLTLAEAAEFSGLPAAFLVDRARSGAIRAVNVGTGKREFWRFHREGLAK